VEDVFAPAVAQPTRESFAAYVAHELRTPLATQRALLELALADPGTDLAAWREIGADALCACRQQERLVEACLTLARSNSGLQRNDPVDLAAIAANVLRAHEAALARVVVLREARTSGDAELVELLVANLVANAIRHNTAGGWIHVATRSNRGHAVLSVVNTGPVIPAREVQRLFRPFERLDDTGAGAGLGLTIVQAVAEAHDATVTARTRSDGGLAIDVVFSALD